MHLFGVSRACWHCGVAFRATSRSSEQAAAGLGQRFCSNVCSRRSPTGGGVKPSLQKARREFLKVLTSRAECELCHTVFVGRARWCKSCYSWGYRAAHVQGLPQELECKHCGNTFLQAYGRLFCSERCTRHYHKQLRYAVQHSSDAERITFAAVYERDGGICQLCGNEAQYPTIDHNVSLASGGRHTWGNVQLACFACNAIKRQKVRVTWDCAVG
jgi:hypothetical protein